ncbi:hypothetical protein EI94DRAFT_1700844 [Lactarius quietus]|nr:hypothetical protein EI94DRAFT_1700844 [Lactarius quietus]
MARRASYTNEDNLFSMAIGNNSSQSSLPAYRRLSHSFAFTFVLSLPALALIANLRILAYVRSRVSPAAPYPPSKPTRRPAHTHTSQPTSTSTRRGSLPALHLHTSSQSTHTVSIAPPDMHENSENDLYSHINLNAFSFGAPTVHHDTDMPSPLSVQAPSESGHSCTTGSTDRTPRPSISHPRDSGDSGGEDETRRNRVKIRAIDVGARRPSLPTNQYTSNHPTTDDLAGPSSRSNPETSGSDSEPIASGNTSDIEFDGGNDSGVVDTDVELESIAPDDASQRTFGLIQCADWYIVDPNERRQEAGSPVTFATDEDDDSDVSEGGTRGLAAIRRSSIAIHMASTRDRSFKAVNSDILPTPSSARQREDSTTTLRRPSYNEPQGDSFATLTGPSRDQQPPLPPANWTMFGNNAGISPSDNSGERVYQGMDLDYIMNVSDLEGRDMRRSSLSFIAPQSLPLPPPKDRRKVRDKEKHKKDTERGNEDEFNVDAMRGLIGGPSSDPSNLLDVAPWAGMDDASGPRRPSTVTLDDTFAGGLRRDDPDYALRRKEWSFVRERERVFLPIREPDGNPRHWDVWRCSQIGQIRIERATLPPSDPNKPNQQRLNAEHDVDPASMNTLGGPTTVVHRHSRALAFSIYRHYNLKHYRSTRTRNSTTTMSAHVTQSGESRTLVMPTHDGILLATKRVQEQFTTTKSTSKLASYGLLPGEVDDHRDSRRDPNSSHPRRTPQDWSTSSTQREPPGIRHIVDLRILEGLDGQSSSSSTRGSEGSSLDLSGMTAFASTSQSISSTGSTGSLMFASDATVLDRPLTPHVEAEEDSDSEFLNPVSRTSHAEAFATLTKHEIDQLKKDQLFAQATKRSQGWIQRFITSSTGGNTSRTIQSSLTPINPGWMTLATRTKQEEQDRAIQGLRSSFKDVGLVPSTRSKSGVGIGRRGKGKNKDMLTQVPNDSLYMLLPLWPHETDPASTAREPKPRRVRLLDQEKNLYLLVYYVPFDQRGEGDAVKKRSRSRPRKGERERQHPTPQFDVRRGFKVIGRLITYSDLNGAGIRLPVRGLSVTGSLAEAELGIPPASLRDVHSDDFVLGACLDRSGAIEFFPEGLEKLGLCVPRTVPPVQIHTHPGMQTAETEDEDVVLQPLTAIGRAAVEIAWLGCMALMTFYGPSTEGPA